jgi:O-antigen/teichoic acid export membrane protein
MTQAFTYSLFLAIPVTAGGIILSDKLLYFLYGAAFEIGAPVLIILLFAQIANIFMYLQTMCLNAMDMPRISFHITAASAVLNIILNVLLIPLFGISGAAFASLVTMMMNAGLSYVMLKSSVNIRIDTKSVVNLFISAFLMSVFIYVYIFLLPIQDFIGLGLILALSAVIYFGTVLGIDRSIRNDLKALLDAMNVPVRQ